ncbi:putative elicitin [Plasmopara halstedii]
MSNLLLQLVLAILLVSRTRSQVSNNAIFKLAPIASASPQSTTFTLVANKNCNATVVTQIYELYAKNRLVFQTCVSDGQYTIFPYTGILPTPQQIKGMSSSLACRAIFMSVLLCGIPECVISNLSVRAAVETLLKIGVNMDIYPNASNVNPFTDRFVELVRWRRDVNLAQDAHLPCDSGSKLYAEYASNLFSITTSGLYRLTSDKEIQFRSTINGVFSQDLIIAKPSVLELQGSGSGIMVVVVSPTEASQGSTSASIDVAASDLEPKAISKESLISPVIESSDAISKEATARTFSSGSLVVTFWTFFMLIRESSQSWESLSTNLYYDVSRFNIYSDSPLAL